MTKILKISSLLIALFILCAPSCNDEQEAIKREEEILNSAKNDIKKEFESDYLDEAALFAHEASAFQKLIDFSDYVKVLADTSLELSFREKAGEMIANSFQSEEVYISLNQEKQKPQNKTSVQLLIAHGLENKLIIPPFYFDSIKVQEPLTRKGNSTYSGKIICLQTFNTTSKAEKVPRTVEILVSKKDKVFGSETLKVWNTCLGEIR